MRKLFIFVFLFVFQFHLSVLAQKKSNPSSSDNISAQKTTGAVVGTFTGFGIGQAIQGRYSETGWIVTSTQVAGVLLLLRGGFLATCRNDDGTAKECDNKGSLQLGGLIYVGSRFYEIYDLWTNINSSVALLPTKSGVQATYTLNF